MNEYWTFAYYVIGFLTINLFFIIIPYIAPGLTPHDIMPYQIFFIALIILNCSLPEYRSEILQM